MYHIELNISGQRLTASTTQLRAETIDYLTCRLTTSPDWDGLDICVKFRQGDTVRDVLATDGTITADKHLNLPVGAWSVSCVGTRVVDGSVVQRITTGAAVIRVGAAVVTDGEPFPVEPSVGEQLLAAARSAESVAQAVRADADAGAFDGAPGRDGAVGQAGQDGADCDYSLVANALRKTLSGTAIRADDVSPLAHNLSVVQYGQCVQDGTPTPAAPIEITGKAAGGAVGNGTITTQTLTVTDADGDGVTLYGVPVTSDGNVTIGTQQYVADTLEGTTLTRRVSGFDGGEVDWEFLDSRGGYFRTNTTPAKATGGRNLICGAYPTVYQDLNTDEQFICGANSAYIYLKNTAYTSAAELKASLSGVMFYYELATPVTETVAVSPATLGANSPTTTWTSEAHTALTYNRDINAAVAELAAAIVAAGGSI